MFEAESSLEKIKRGLEENVAPSPWDRLKTATGNMELGQIAWVMKQDKVVQAWTSLKSTFDNWLFERWKEDFGKVQAYRPLVDNYINAVIEAAQGYGVRASTLEAENAELRKQIEELKANAK